MDKEVLSPEEAARYIDVHPQTIYRLLRQGEIPGRKIGRQWRILKAALDDYLRMGAPGADGLGEGSVERPAPEGGKDEHTRSPSAERV